MNDEERIQQYLGLIQELLSCPNGEEGNILSANMELMDLALVEVMGQYATYLRDQGEAGGADFLVDMAAHIANFLQPSSGVNLEILTNFCGELLRAEIDGGQMAVFTVLAKHLELVNENLGQALIAVQQRWLSSNDDPELREAVAKLVENISIHLTNFPLGDPRGKIISAIAGYQYVLSLRTDDPEKTAQTQNNLGLAYSDLAPFSENPKQEIENAISTYRNALRVRKEAELPQGFAGTQNNLGIAYSRLAPFSENPKQEIENAIAAYRNALRVYKEAEFPQDFAGTQNNLGIAYSHLAPFSENPNQEIERAISAYRNALQVYKEAELPQAYATTQNNLGIAYSRLAPFSKNPKQEIENAIAAYRNALRVYKEAEFPQDFAGAQNNLGSAYSDLAPFSENPKQEIENAISAYRNALQVYKEAELPQAYATTQNGLGIAYSRLAPFSKNPKQEIERAIPAFRNALRVYKEAELPQNFATTQNNLGSAYSDLAPFSENPKQEIENAIAAFRNALRVYKEAEFPQAYATTQNNLGSAYSRLAPFSENPKQEIENAIAAYRNALRVYKEAELPQDFAGTQNNLGLAYSDLAPFSENPKQEIENAIAAYRNALRVRTVDLRSTDCLQTARNLGKLGFKQSLWEIAIEGYAKAIEAVENIRSWSKDEARREEVHAESIEIYSNIVQAHINLNQFEQAFSYVERSRSKRLLDLMHVHDFYKHGEIPQPVRELLDRYDRLQANIDKIYHSHNNHQSLATTLRRSPNENEEQIIQSLRQQQTQIWQQIRQLDPVAAAGTRVAVLDLNTAAQLLNHRPTTALINFFSTRENTCIFILRLSVRGEIKIDLHHLQGEGIDNLHDWIFDEWIVKSKNNRQQWADNAETFLADLSQRLQLNDLIANHLQGIEELILIPHLYLHQVPFIALPIDPPPPPLQKAGLFQE